MSKSIFFIVILWFTFIEGQNPISKNLNAYINFPTANYYDLIEDNQNNIWLSTNIGVFKYDGYSCEKINNLSAKSEALFHLQKDANNVLWGINIYGQLFKLDDGEFKVFLDLGKRMTGQLPNFRVLNKYILFYSDKGVYQIDKRNKSLLLLTKENIVSSYISKDKSYYTTLGCSTLFSFQNNQAESIFALDSKGIYNASFFNVFQKYILFKYQDINHNNHLFYINLKTNFITRIKTPNALKKLKIISIRSVGDEVWFCTDDGVKVFTLYDDGLAPNPTKEYFKGQSISHFIKDFKNNFWFVDLDRGVFVVENMNHFAVNLSKGKIVAGTYLKNNQFILATNQNNLLVYDGFTLLRKIKLKDCTDIYSLYYNKFKNEIIVSTKNRTSFIYHISQGTYSKVENKYTIAKSINFITPSLTFYGNYKEGYLYENNTFKKTRSKRVITSASNQDDLLISYSDGLYHYDIQKKTNQKLFFENKDIFVVKIQSINNGLILLDNQNRVLQFYKGKLINIKKISNLKPKNIFYHRDYLWFINQNGQLMHYNISTKKIEKHRFYSSSLGNYNTFFLDDYVVDIHPFKFELFSKHNYNEVNNDNLSNVIIEKLIVNNVKEKLTKRNFKSNQNKIDFHFKTSGYLAKNRICYEYQLAPLDDKWQTLDVGIKSISFKELPSGNYTFSVRAKNISGGNYSNIASKEFTIAKHFWQTWWFYLLVILFLSGIIYAIFRKTQANKAKKQQILVNKLLQDKHIATLKLENLRSQMNPHFIFNALNSIQDYIVSNRKNLASSYLVKFSMLIRLYLEYSQQKSITLAQEIEALEFYLVLEKLRFDGELNYEIEISKTLNINYRVPSLFIQPYVENAIKHGLLHKEGPKNLIVSFEDDTNHLKVIIQDNGIGRIKSAIINKENGHQSFATKANNEMVTIYNTVFNKDINVEINDLYDEKIPIGTKVIITILKEV